MKVFHVCHLLACHGKRKKPFASPLVIYRQARSLKNCKMATETGSSLMPGDPRDMAEIEAILWLDERCETAISKRKAAKFQLAPTFRTFASPKPCEDYIRERQSRLPRPSIVVMMSGAFARSQIPALEDYSCIFAFMIYCGDKSLHADLRYSKLRGVFDSEIDVYRCLKTFTCAPIDLSITSLFSVSNAPAQGMVRRHRSIESQFEF